MYISNLFIAGIQDQPELFRPKITPDVDLKLTKCIDSAGKSELSLML